MSHGASLSPITASDEIKRSPESRVEFRCTALPLTAVVFSCIVMVLALFLAPGAMALASAEASPPVASPPATSPAARSLKASPQEAGGTPGTSVTSASSWVMTPAQTGVVEANQLKNAAPVANAPLSFPPVLPAYQGTASTAATPTAGSTSAGVQVGVGAPFAATAGLSFDAIGNGVAGLAVHSIPASGTAAAGTTQIVETANQYFAVYDKTNGALAAGFPKNLGALFSSISACNTAALWNPVVLYDQLAQRWLITAISTQQSAVSKPRASSLCVAISENDDATGQWNVMSYSPRGGQGADYYYDSVRAALWPDAYTFTYNLWDPSGSTFMGVALCGLDRNGLLAPGSRLSSVGQAIGGPAQNPQPTAGGAPLQVCTLLNNSYDADLAPVTLDGPNYPPPGAKALFVETAKGMGAASTYSNLFMYRAAFDFQAGTVTVDPVVNIPVNPYDARICDAGKPGTGWPNCAPQRAHSGGCYLQDKPAPCGTQDNLDVFPGSIGYRAAYRNFGAYESLVFTATVRDGGEPDAANRWWEIRNFTAEDAKDAEENQAKTGSVPSSSVSSAVSSLTQSGIPAVFQDSTYSPDSSLHRFLGSLAQDHMGNMLLGYTGSGSSEFPSIFVTGREPSDPANTMEREQRVFAGLNARVNVGDGEYPHSWGAMSSMAMDPDDCTFWYTNEYLPTAGMFNWRSRIASFNFGSGCSDAASITLPVPATSGGAPLASSTATFYWTPGSGRPKAYTLSVGSARGGTDLCAPVTYPAGTYKATLTCLPSNAGAFWVRLATIGRATSGATAGLETGATSQAASRFQDYEFTTVGGGGVTEEASPEAHSLVTSTTTTLALTTGMSTAQIGASLTFTATVTVNGAPTPTGDVTFKSGSTAITGCSALALTGTAPYQAACATSVLAKGTDSITAVYSGDANTSASTSSALSETIVTQETITTVSSTGPLYSGLTANLNAIVSVAGTSCCEEDQYTIPGSSPVAVLYDGASFWTANNGSNSVTKLVQSGEVLGTFPAGTAPVGLAFDGANIWVANSGGLTKLRQDNGAQVASYAVGGTAVLFDGTNIWTTNKSAGTLIKVNPSNGSVLATYTLGNSPGAMAFDGTNLWVANGNGTVSKVVASSGAVAGTFTVGTNPGAVLYDGTNIWVGNSNGTVSKLLATTGALQATYTVGGAVTGLEFDGASIAAANGSAFVVFNPANGAYIYSLAAPGASGMAYSPNALEFVGTSSGTYGLISFAAAPGAAATPTGTVKFTSNGTTISGCSAQVLGSNSGRYVAGCGTPALTTGNYNIVATYAGDTNTASSTSPTYVQVVYAVGTTITTLTNQYSTNTSTQGSPVTFLAEVVVEGVSNPTGTVAFKNNGTAISGCGAVPLNGSSGTYLETCTANSLPLGANSIVATYSGDAHTTTSSSSALIQTVVGSETITTVSSSSNPSVYGQPVTFTATVTPPPVYSSQNFAIGGTTPYSLTFDGANIWTANPTSNNVTKLLAATGAVVGTYAVGTNPHALTFDGANIWVINETGATMTKIRASDGTVLGTFSTEQDPVAVLYDGTYIWTANLTGSDVTQWQPSSGQALSDYCCFDFPEALAYDGANLWVSDIASVVQKLQVSTGKLIGGYLVGNSPLALLFDGANMWAANNGSGSVSKIQVSTGQTLGTFAIGSSGPSGLAFDGNNLWVAGDGAITELQASTGAYVASYPLQYAFAALYDGANIWVGYNSTLANYVTRFSPSAGSFVVAPTGSVSFSANGVPVSGCTVQSLTGSAPYKATCMTSALAGGTDTIVATYSGDSNNQGSTSSNFSQTVTLDPTTTTVALTSGSNPSAYGSSLMFRATVAVTAGPETPTGTVSFTSNGVGISGCSALPLTGSGPYTASCTSSALPVGADSIVAAYSGDANTAGSTSSGLSQSVSMAMPQVTITSVSAGYGSTAPVQVSAAISWTGSATPSGAVSIGFVGSGSPIGGSVGATSCGSPSGNSFTCKANYTPSGTLAVGTYAPPSYNTIAATIAADANYSQASSGGDTVTIGAVAPSVVITPTPAVTTYGSTAGIGLTVTVTGAGPADAAPSGTVSLAAAAGSFSAPSCSSSGDVLTCTSTYSPSGTLALGSYPAYLAASITAAGNYLSASGTDNLNVIEANTTTAVSSSVNPSVFGQSVTFTATVSSASGFVRKQTTRRMGAVHSPGVHSEDVTGTVTWSANTGCGTTPVSGTGGTATATCTTSALPVGTGTITANYSGDSNHSGGSGSLNGGQVVNQASTSATVASSLNPSTYGQTVGFTATLAAVAPGAGVPTGTVQFVVDGANFGAPVLLSAGVATSGSTTTLSSGTHTVSAVYSGDTNFTTSTGMLSGGQEVNNASAATTVSSSVNPSVFGQSVTFTATINGQYGLIKKGGIHSLGVHSEDVTGTVTWSANTGCGTAPVSGPGGTGTATCTTLNLPLGTDTITANYSGDSNHSASSGSLNGGQVVNQASTSATVASSLNPSTYGQAVSFTATVAASAPGAGTPTGTVQFVVDGSNFGAPVTLSSGAATSGSTTTLTVGTHMVSAVYSGDTNFTTSTGSLSGGQVVTSASAATTVTSSVNPSIFGQLVTFTATINGQYGLIKTNGIHAPGVHSEDVTGTVTWSLNTGCGTTPVSGTGGTGTATCTTSSLPFGTDAITANYSGDNNHSGGSGSLSGGQVVNQASTSNSVASSLNPSTYGQAVSFTATVGAVGPGAGSPTGTVQFVVDGSNFGSPVGLSSGSASSGSTTTLAAGTHSVSAVYSGDANFTTSTGTLGGGQVVNNAGAATTVSSSMTPSVFGQPVTFTATISGQYGLIKKAGIHSLAVTGTVAWSANTGCGTTPVSGTGGTGMAICTTSTLPVGTDTITANYSGDSNHSGSSGSLNGGQVVNQASTSSAVASSLNPSTYGQAVSFTATVAASAPGAGAPSGTVQFVVDGSSFGSPVSLTAGAATSGSTTTLAAGSHTVSAAYSGDTNFTTSTGTLSGGQVVNSAGAATTVNSSVNPSVFGQSVTFTATINGQYGLIKRNGIHALDVTGTVAWSANTGCGTTPISGTGGTGTAACTTSALPVGTNTITASYSGDSNHSSGSGSLNGGQVVNQASTSTGVSANLNPSAFGQTVTFTATVGAVGPGSGTPTGTVPIIDTSNGNAAVCTVTLVGGTGTCTSSTLAEGAHNLSGSYSGDANFTGSTGSLAQTVNGAGTTTSVTSSVNPSVFGQSVTFTASISSASGMFRGETIRRAGSVHTLDVTGTVSWSANTGCGTTPVSGSGGTATATCTTSALPVGTDTVTANYSGDSNHSASSGLLNGGQVVNQASTSSAVTSSLNPSTYGQAVNFTASVTASAPGAGTPTGTVQFVVDGSNFGAPVMLSGGSAASGSTTTLLAGTHTVSAVYSGDTNFTTSMGTLSGGQMVNNASAAATVTSSVNPSVFGQSVTFTATVNGQYGLIKKSGIHALGVHSEDVTGTVSWSANTGCGTTPVSGSGGTGTATCTTSILPVGTDAITLNYSGDSNHSGSSGSLNGGQMVNQASTSATVASSLNPSTYGQTVSFTATVVANAPGSGIPTGAVQFVVDGGNFGSPVTLSLGSASSGSTTTLAAGTHSVSAVYSGDTNFTTSMGTLGGGQVVNNAGAATAVSSSVNPSVFGQPVTFTAMINGQYGLIKRNGIHALDVTGTVTWSANTGCGTTPVSGTGGTGTATCTTSILPVGTDVITANYSGDSNHSGSTGSLNGGQVVGQVNTSSAVTSSLNPSNVGQAVNFTASVTAVAPGEGTPTGTVQFVIDSANFGFPVALSGGSATSASTTTLSGGTHTVMAVYSGDSNFKASTGSLSGGQVVNQSISTTTTTVSSSRNPSTYGQSVTFTASVASSTGNMTGTVAWSANTGCGSTPLSGSGTTATATCATSILPVGTDVIMATYSGDTAHSGSTGTLSGGELVNPYTPTISVGNMTTGYGSTTGVTAAITVAGLSGGSNLTGAVSCASGSTTGGSCAVSSCSSGASITCTATWTPTGTLAAGTYVTSTITATIAAAGNYAANTSAANSVTVNKASSTTSITSNTPNPSAPSQAVTIAFTVSGIHTPTGSVKVTASTGETCTGSLASGSGSCQITFTTTGSRTLTAGYSGDNNFNTSNSAPVTQNVNASGPTVSLSPSSYNFGNIYLGKSASTQFTLSNTGTTTLTISKIAIGTTGTDPDDFTESNNCHATLAAGKSCTITVTFASDSDVLGLNTGALTVSDNATGSPQTATLSATVINPLVKLSPASLNFGSQKVSTTSAAKTITLTNSGTTTLTLGAMSITGDFAIASGATCTNGGSVTAGASCKINVTFTPKAKGTRTGTLTITDNALNSPQSVALSGTGD